MCCMLRMRRRRMIKGIETGEGDIEVKSGRLWEGQGDKGLARVRIGEWKKEGITWNRKREGE